VKGGAAKGGSEGRGVRGGKRRRAAECRAKSGVVKGGSEVWGGGGGGRGEQRRNEGRRVTE
jgi:hypothetical protein